MACGAILCFVVSVFHDFDRNETVEINTPTNGNPHRPPKGGGGERRGQRPHGGGEGGHTRPTKAT